MDRADLQQVFRREAFDRWCHTPGGFPVTTYNKQLFVMGRQTGTDIRPYR